MKKSVQKTKRQMRVRKKIRRIDSRHRLSVFRSNHRMYAQIIDDLSGKTLVGVSEKNISEDLKGTKTEKARILGGVIAKEAAKHKIIKVVFDRGSYMYHGRVKAFAEGAREGGLQF